MKKIIPFNNVLTFETDVCEITAISLEPAIEKKSDAISGVFYISGEYKITDGQLEKNKFNFELPFDIALGSEYNFKYDLRSEGRRIQTGGIQRYTQASRVQGAYVRTL